MIKFVTPSRYDEELAQKGISIAIDEEGTYYGTFDCKCYDPFNPRFKADRERYLRNHKATIKALKEEQHKSIHQFVHMAMFGWSDIMSEDGPVPFSKDAAFEFLTQTKVGLYTFGALLNQASDITNFKAADVEVPGDDEEPVDPMSDVDDVAKN